MALPARYRLTVDLLTITGRDIADVEVSVEMAEKRLITLDDHTLIPTTLSGTSDSAGVVEFDIFPSSLVGDYTVSIGGGFQRTITMPEAASRLSGLMDS